MSEDPVNPSHYKMHGGIEAFAFIESNGLDFSQGSVVKYVTRFKHKGTPLVDLKKAKFYLDKLIASEESKASANGYV